MWFTSLVIKNVWRRKVRSLLTCVSLAVSVCAVVAMLGTAEGYESHFSKMFEARGADIIVSQKGAAQGITSRVEEDFGPQLQAVPGVKRVEPVLADLRGFEERKPGLKLVYIFGLRDDATGNTQMELISGRRLRADDYKHIAVGRTLAELLNLKVGDMLDLYGPEWEFEVVGIYDSLNSIEAGGAVVPLRALQKALGQQGRVTMFLVSVQDSGDKDREVRRVIAEIAAIKEYRGARLDLDVKSRQEHVDSALELQVMKGLAWAASTLALLIGLVSMLNTMMMSISERIREIATLRAVGWKEWRVLRMILSEAMVLAAVGAVVGVLAAMPLMGVLARYGPTSSVVTKLTPDILAKGVGLGMLAGLFGAFYPAFLASRLSPALALRHE